MVIPQKYRPVEKKATPSTLSKIQKCHGFFNGHTDVGHGNKIHKICQEAIKAYYSGTEQNTYQYESERSAANTMVQVLSKIEEYTHVTNYSIEHSLDLSFIPKLANGSADIVIFSAESRRQRADLIEIKTGNGKQTCNIRQDDLQCKAYALGLMKEYPDLEVVYSWLVKPTVRKYYFKKWERVEVMSFEHEINDILNNYGEIRPNENCAICPNKMGCKERFTPGLIAKMAIENEKVPTGKEALLYLYLHRNEINGLLREAKEMFEGASPEEIETIEGFNDLIIKQRNKKKYDIKALERAFMSKGISVHLLYHEVQNSVNQIEEVALQNGFTLEELEQYKINEKGSYFLDIEK